MDNIEKRICPKYGAPVRVAFAEYCYRCGVQFSETVVTRNRSILKVECLQTGGTVGADIRDEGFSTEGVSK